MRSALLAGQVALTLVLLVGAGLLARSFLHLLAIDPGYRTSGAVAMDLLFPYAEDEAEKARLARVSAELLERVSAIPGVEAAGAVDVFPLSGGGSNGTFLILNHPGEVEDLDDWREPSRDEQRTGLADYRIATAGYFRAMGIPPVRGRLFDERDHPDAPPAAVISPGLARLRWPGEDPIGKLIQYGNMDGDLRPYTIVGVVGDVRERSLEAEPRPTFYGNALQRPSSVGGPLAARRFSLVLLGAFAAAALLLAVGGIYGVISHLVAQRTREIGIRLALGADPRDVLRLVVGRGVALALVGVAVGLFVSLAATRVPSGLLYGTGPRDPVTFVGVPLLLAGVAALAS